MTPFLSKISGNFDGLFGMFFGKDGVTVGSQAYDLGLTKKYKWAGDGAICESTKLPGLGNKIDGFVAINRYIPVFQGPLDTPYLHRFFDDAKARLAKIDSSGPLPDRYVQSNYEAMNALKVAMVASKFEGRDDTEKLIEALEGLEMERKRRLPARRQDAAQGRPSGVPARVPVCRRRRQLQTGDGGQGQDHLSAGLQFFGLGTSTNSCSLANREGREVGAGVHTTEPVVVSSAALSVFSQALSKRRVARTAPTFAAARKFGPQHLLIQIARQSHIVRARSRSHGSV
jgi:hypothetical protein